MRMAVITLTMLASMGAWGLGARGADRFRPAAGGSTTVECTFSNPGYAGRCTEAATASEKETPEQACQQILECLNNARCVKTYCGSTTIREGWKLESAKVKEE